MIIHWQREKQEDDLHSALSQDLIGHRYPPSTSRYISSSSIRDNNTWQLLVLANQLSLENASSRNDSWHANIPHHSSILKILHQQILVIFVSKSDTLTSLKASGSQWLTAEAKTWLRRWTCGAVYKIYRIGVFSISVTQSDRYVMRMWEWVTSQQSLIVVTLPGVMLAISTCHLLKVISAISCWDMTASFRHVISNKFQFQEVDTSCRST
jgi:hypothetical protein